MGPKLGDHIFQVPEYTSRFIYFDGSNCAGKYGIQTATMQLRQADGYRPIQYIHCHVQRRTKWWRCECGVLWRECDIHRIDPLVHHTTRGTKRDMPPAGMHKKSSWTRTD